MPSKIASRSISRTSSLVAAGIVASANIAMGVDHSWIGPNGASWGLSSNWSPSGVPLPSTVDRVFLNSAAVNKSVFYDFDYPTIALAPNSIEIQSEISTGKVTLQLNPSPGTKKLCANNIAVGEQGIGELDDSAQQITTNTFYVGFNSTGVGTVQLSGTANLNLGYVSVGQVGSGTINQSGNSMMVINGYDMANFGTAYHRVSGGALSFPTGRVNVGWHGHATLEVSGGSVSGNEMWVASGALFPPDYPEGVGSVLVSGTGQVSLNSLWIGLQPEPPPDPEDPPPPGDIVGGNAFVSVQGPSAALTATKINSRGTNIVNNNASLSVGIMNVGHLGEATLTINASRATIGSLVVGLDAPLGAVNPSLVTTTGSLTVSGDATVGAGSPGRFVQTAGPVRVNGNLVLGSVAGSHGEYRISGGSLSVGGVMTVGQAGVSTLQLDGGRVQIPTMLKVRPTGVVNFNGGQIDLSPGGMIVDHSGGASPIAALRARIVQGYANGAWNGAGIMSSLAATTPGRAIGYAEATDIFTTFPASFMGQSVNAQTVLMRYTYAGDANLDATVDTVDFNLLAANFSQSGKNWVNGDFNYDATVDTVDFNLLASNFGQVLPASSVAFGAMVPEPAMTIVSSAIGGVLLLRRRSNRARM